MRWTQVPGPACMVVAALLLLSVLPDAEATMLKAPEKESCKHVVNAICSQLCNPKTCTHEHILYKKSCLKVTCANGSQSEAAYHLFMTTAPHSSCKDEEKELQFLGCKTQACTQLAANLRSHTHHFWTKLLDGVLEAQEARRGEHVKCEQHSLNFRMGSIDSWAYDENLLDVFPENLCQEMAGKTFPCYGNHCMMTSPIVALFGMNDILASGLKPEDDDRGVQVQLSWRIRGFEDDSYKHCAKAIRGQLRSMIDVLRHSADVKYRTVFFSESLKKKCPYEGDDASKLIGKMAHATIQNGDIVGLLDVYLNTLGNQVNRSMNPRKGKINMYGSLQERVDRSAGEAVDDMPNAGTLLLKSTPDSSEYEVVYGINIDKESTWENGIQSSEGWENSPEFFYAARDVMYAAGKDEEDRVPKRVTKGVKGKSSEYQLFGIVTETEDTRFSAISRCDSGKFIGGDLGKMEYLVLEDSDDQKLLTWDAKVVGKARVVLYTKMESGGDAESTSTELGDDGEERE